MTNLPCSVLIITSVRVEPPVLCL
uniref:Uncharacterized protein n=1 Tax=Anguilla anguilla TaxID=7936 RepID=A0A0E9V8A4_ANGAN